VLRDCAFHDTAKLAEIGRLRYSVWEGEGSVCPELFPDRVWVDAMDQAATARHWFVQNEAGEVVAAARLTIHGESDDYRDVELWRANKIRLKFPVCDLGRLVVRKDARGVGLATRLNEVRINAARAWGAGAIICTASAGNKRLLTKHHGFVALDHTIVFGDRPNTTFHAIHLLLE
jgi:predicted GNAT family N-acyltransferase